MDEEARCPRCGVELVRGQTDARKVCFDCPTCGGRQITLPVLREALGGAGVAALTRAARALEHPGCVCPGCGATMSLAKVGIDGRTIEIDVCGTCLSVWCDRGEYDALVPKRESAPGKRTMAELARQASPEARERLAEAMLERLPEEVDPSGVEIGEVLMDVVRLVAGVPTLWRDIRPVTPIFSNLMLLAIAVLHPVFFYATRGLPSSEIILRGRSFWILDRAMATLGFSPSSWTSAFSFPFVQFSGNDAVCHVLMLLPVFSVVERRSGHRKFIALLASFWATAVLVHLLAAASGWTSGALCGIAPIAAGFCGFALRAYPDANLSWGGRNVMPTGIYSALVLLATFALSFLGGAVREWASVGFFPSVACLALGAFFFRRPSKQDRTKTEAKHYEPTV